MQKSNKTYEEIITGEMIDFAKLVIKYSPSQLAAMATAVDLDNLQLEMGLRGATREEIRTSSELHHDIWEMMRMCGISS